MERFNEEHLLFRESLRAFVEREIAPFVDQWERDRAFPARELYRKMGSEGYFGLTYPEECGGLGLDFWYKVIWIEEMGSIDSGGIPMSLTVQTEICTPVLEKHGSRELKQRFLVPAVKGEVIGALAITEPGAGSDVFAIKTSARAEGDHLVLRGQKSYVTNGSIADFIVTLCRTPSDDSATGMSLIVVPGDTPGLKVRKKYEDTKLGNLCCDHAELTYEDVVVPRRHLIGAMGMGWEIQMEQFQHERLIEAILACSQARAILESTKAYAKERSVFGGRLIDQQSVAFRLVDMEMEAELLRQMTYTCAERLMSGKECTRETAMLKLKAGRLVREVADECLHLLGGYGYMEDARMSRRLRDVRALALTGGSVEVMQRILSKFL
jgi:citronellyl-CoA dehydrogenase